MKNWKPWDDFKEDLPTLPISEPPCKECIYWKPMRKYFVDGPLIGQFDGVVLCTKSEMCHDFSCFEPNPEAKA